jgi:hypothetical protein
VILRSEEVFARTEVFDARIFVRIEADFSRAASRALAVQHLHPVLLIKPRAVTRCYSA